MCPTVSEKPKRACKGVTLSVKHKVIKCFDCSKDIVHALTFGSGNAQNFFHIN